MKAETAISIFFGIVLLALVLSIGYAWWTGRLNSGHDSDDGAADVALVGATSLLSGSSRVAEIAEVTAAEEAGHRHTQT